MINSNRQRVELQYFTGQAVMSSTPGSLTCSKISPSSIFFLPFLSSGGKNGGCGRQTVPPFVLWLLVGRLFVRPEGTKDGTLLDLRTMHHGCTGGTAAQ